MANNLNVNPMVLDTVGATSAITTPLRIKAIEWQGTDDVHDIIFHDASGGNIVWQAKLGDVSVNGYNASFNPTKPVHFTGLYLTTKDSGTALVYV